MNLSWLVSLLLFWGCRSRDGRWVTLVNDARLSDQEEADAIARLPLCLDGCRGRDGNFVGTIHPECESSFRKGTGLWQCAEDIPKLHRCPR